MPPRANNVKQPYDPGTNKRVKGRLYKRKNGEIGLWRGFRWNCKHGRERDKCKDCGGAGICEHGRRRTQCKDCGGSAFCEHGRRRTQCKDCGGASICDHGRIRTHCKLCGGSGICDHGRQRPQCRECGGASICHHGRRRVQCKDCGGSQICEHGRIRQHCTEGSCGLLPSSKKCKGCCSKLVNPIPGVPSTSLCATCRDEYGVSSRKKWEEQTEIWLNESGLLWSYCNKKLPCAPTTRYPDYMFVAREHCVLLEVDEQEHERYNPKCEIARISELMDSIDFKSLHVIRYNPHAPGSTADRKATLLQAIRDALATNFGVLNESGCVVQYQGYSQDRIVQLDALSCAMQDQHK